MRGGREGAGAECGLLACLSSLPCRTCPAAPALPHLRKLKLCRGAQPSQRELPLQYVHLACRKEWKEGDWVGVSAGEGRGTSGGRPAALPASKAVGRQPQITCLAPPLLPRSPGACSASAGGSGRAAWLHRGESSCCVGFPAAQLPACRRSCSKVCGASRPHDGQAKMIYASPSPRWQRRVLALLVPC